MYINIQEFLPEEVFPYVPVNARKKIKKEFLGYNIKISSERLILFKSNPTCVCCGVTGNVLVLQTTQKETGSPHFNFYHKSKDKFILMTKDHILPIALGGKDRLDNYQTMCEDCNGLKGHTILSLEELKENVNENRSS